MTQHFLHSLRGLRLPVSHCTYRVVYVVLVNVVHVLRWRPVGGNILWRWNVVDPTLCTVGSTTQCRVNVSVSLVSWLVVRVLCLLATSKESYQDGYRLVTVHSWRVYSAVPLGNQAIGSMSQYPTRGHYSDQCANQSMPYSIDFACQARTRQV